MILRLTLLLSLIVAASGCGIGFGEYVEGDAVLPDDDDGADDDDAANDDDAADDDDDDAANDDDAADDDDTADDDDAVDDDDTTPSDDDDSTPADDDDSTPTDDDDSTAADDDDTTPPSDDDDSTPPPSWEDCDNGLDDDGDGWIDCDDSDCDTDPACSAQDCVPQFALQPGVTDSWNNAWAGSTNGIDQYPCSGALLENGPEYAYSFTAPSTGTANVVLEMTFWIPLGPELDVFVLDGSGTCEPSACIAAGVEFGHEDLDWAVTAGSTYYIVVEGYEGAEMFYDITVDML